MAEISVTWDQKDFDPFVGGKVEQAIVRALSKSGGDAIRAVRAEGKRRVRARKSIKASYLSDQALPISFPKGKTISAMVWRMAVSGKPVPLGKYPARQTKKGVSVLVNKGQRRLIQSAFLATMASGHQGVFIRKGAARLPIKHALSSRVSDVFADKGMAKDVLLRGHTVYGSAFRRLLPMELEKASR